MSNSRDDFSKAVINALSKRASFICSNPDCRALTLAPIENDASGFINLGVACHITAAAPGGPRYDPSITPDTRSSIDNAIYLCRACAHLIDATQGIDFSVETLVSWKQCHEKWIRDNLNKRIDAGISIVDGQHHARGVGQVTGIDAQGPIFIQPGTVSTAEGKGTVTATRIGGKQTNER